MQPQGGRGPPPDPELEQRFRQASFGGAWQPGIAFAGQYGAAYGLPYAVAPAFPSQAQLAYLTPARSSSSGSAQGMPQWNQAQAAGSRPSSALGQRQTVPVSPAAAMPQFAAFYPQASAGYPMQYLSPLGQWGSLSAQQATPAPFIPQSQGVMAPFAFPGGQVYPQQQGRQGGRQPYRGQPNRHRGANTAQGRGRYQAMWQEVNQVQLVCAMKSMFVRARYKHAMLVGSDQSIMNALVCNCDSCHCKHFMHSAHKVETGFCPFSDRCPRGKTGRTTCGTGLISCQWRI